MADSEVSESGASGDEYPPLIYAEAKKLKVAELREEFKKRGILKKDNESKKSMLGRIKYYSSRNRTGKKRKIEEEPDDAVDALTSAPPAKKRKLTDSKFEAVDKDVIPNDADSKMAKDDDVEIDTVDSKVVADAVPEHDVESKVDAEAITVVDDEDDEDEDIDMAPAIQSESESIQSVAVIPVPDQLQNEFEPEIALQIVEEEQIQTDAVDKLVVVENDDILVPDPVVMDLGDDVNVDPENNGSVVFHHDVPDNVAEPEPEPEPEPEQEPIPEIVEVPEVEMDDIADPDVIAIDDLVDSKSTDSISPDLIAPDIFKRDDATDSVYKSPFYTESAPITQFPDSKPIDIEHDDDPSPFAMAPVVVADTVNIDADGDDLDESPFRRKHVDAHRVVNELQKDPVDPDEEDEDSDFSPFRSRKQIESVSSAEQQVGTEREPEVPVLAHGVAKIMRDHIESNPAMKCTEMESDPNPFAKRVHEAVPEMLYSVNVIL